MMALVATAKAMRPRAPPSSALLRALAGDGRNSVGVVSTRGIAPFSSSVALVRPRVVLVASRKVEGPMPMRGDRRGDRRRRPSSTPMAIRNDVRFFSTPPDAKEKEEQKPEDGVGDGDGVVVRTLKSVMSPQVQFYALVAGGTVGAYGISRVFLGFTGFFTHLTPTVVAKWGFYTGFGCAGMVGGLALMTADNLYIRADPVYRYCLNWVQNDTVVQTKLGDGIQPGSLRSYRMDSGKMEMEGRSVVWRPPRIQMIFDVTATGPPYRTGIVTCEAVKSGGFPPKLNTTLLKIDYETGNEGEEGGGTHEGDETHYLKGSQEEFSRVSRRSGLSLDVLGRSVHIERAAAGRMHK
mmetsp:Transcript_11077/g.24014  ORF Transcript_11077/g.24014 Transcript_11077/m.24014 type:complete len:351 (-) Transcript_11077:320-1372(-)